MRCVMIGCDSEQSSLVTPEIFEKPTCCLIYKILSVKKTQTLKELILCGYLTTLVFYFKSK